VLACPEGYDPDAQIFEAAQQKATKSITLLRSPEEAVAGADVVNTDVWASMGQENEQKARQRVFQNYQINPSLMKLADKDALFMHCLPAHRGEEISADMMEHPRSVVWDEAENRLHAQKALLEFLILNRLD
jgi:ornithine carbamoyltransferase